MSTPWRIVAQDQGRHRAPELVPLGVPLPQVFPEVLIVVGFLIDSLQQVEAVKEEVSRAAGRVQNLELSRVLRRPVRDEDRRPKSLLLG